MPKISIEDIVKQTSQLEFKSISVDYESKNSSDTFPDDVSFLIYPLCLFWFTIINAFKNVGYTEELDKESYVDACKNIEAISDVFKDAFGLKKSIMDAFMNEKRQAENILKFKKCDYMKFKNVLHWNSKHKSHLPAFKVNSIADIPDNNIVFKFRNIGHDGVQVRIGIKTDKDKFKFTIINIQNKN